MFKMFNLVVPGGSGNRYKDPRIEDYVKVRKRLGLATGFQTNIAKFEIHKL